MTDIKFIFLLAQSINYENFWCDGIYPLEEPDELTKIINDKRFLTMAMDFGASGQESYTLNLHFGKKALSRNARNLDLSVCIPNFADEPEYIFIDKENKIVEIELK